MPILSQYKNIADYLSLAWNPLSITVLHSRGSREEALMHLLSCGLAATDDEREALPSCSRRKKAKKGVHDLWVKAGLPSTFSAAGSNGRNQRLAFKLRFPGCHIFQVCS